MFVLLIFCINTLIITMIVDAIILGVAIPSRRAKNYPEEYMIFAPNHMEYQSASDCSAYATAYLMRNMSIDVQAAQVYQEMPNKLRSGIVCPKGILTYLRRQGVSASYKKGNLKNVMQEVSKGTPVIVFLRTYPGKNYLHFLPVVGYDREHIYFVESMKELENCSYEEKGYNRSMTKDEFKILWNMKTIWMPLYSYTYICVKHKDIKKLNKER